MSNQGRGGVDIVRAITSNVVNLFKSKQNICTAPCDGWILKMHYMWTFWIFIGCYSAVWFSWFHKDVITCVSHFSAEGQVRTDYTNICLSYIYVNDNGEKRFLLFYRWVHWVCLLIAAAYYIPRKMSKSYDNPKVKKLFEDLATTVNRYDSVEKENLEKTARYVIANHKTHNGLFYKYLFCNIVALIIDICCFFFLDFVFQGRFMSYGFNAYPFHRNPEDFSDSMSQTFPPFAKCTLGKVVKLLDQRTEDFGCHLTVMELYEKIFLFVWFWLIVLMTITSFYIVYLITYCFPWIRRQMLRVSKPVQATNPVQNIVSSVVSNCKIGDIYLLYRLRQFFSHARYYELLSRLADPGFIEQLLSGVRIDCQANKSNPNANAQRAKQNQGGKFRGKQNIIYQD